MTLSEPHRPKGSPMREERVLAQVRVPGKVILMGEHAVVYGQPALAIPVFGVEARAEVVPFPAGQPGEVVLDAPQVELRDVPVSSLPATHPLRVAVAQALGAAGSPPFPLKVRVEATIPMAAGLGSSAAVSVALIRALTRALGKDLPPEVISALAYEVEKIHHGTPSGVDNTTVAFARPVYFRKGHPPEPLEVGGTFVLLIGDTGVPASTKDTVARVREGWLRDKTGYEARFRAIGTLVEQGRRALAQGSAQELGRLMDENHELLRSLGVSHPVLERLVFAAREAGAWGAKLSGGGGGGNIIALVPPEKAAGIRQALQRAGAVRVWTTTLRPRVEK